MARADLKPLVVSHPSSSPSTFTARHTANPEVEQEIISPGGKGEEWLFAGKYSNLSPLWGGIYQGK